MTRTIGVIGAGTMGSGIAQVVAAKGFEVILIDINEAVVKKSLDGMTKRLSKLVEKGKMAQDDVTAILHAIKGATTYDGLKNADFVIEAATEDFDLKVKILKALDPMVGEKTIVASNTSSVSITKLAAAMSHPDRFIGLHFFNPVPLMALVEIVRGLQTSDATHAAAMAFTADLAKSPITVKSMPGFVVNRLLLPMLNEAFFVLAEGSTSAQEIDEGMKLGCNHPIGPLALADMIGLDVLLSVMEILHEEFADSKYRPCPLLREMVAAGYLGRKTGRGVFTY